MKHELEKALEDRCVARVEALGGLALKLLIPGVRGFPDRLILGLGPTWCAEFKRGRTGKISAQQYEWQNKLARVNVNVYFVASDIDFRFALEKEWPWPVKPA